MNEREIIMEKKMTVKEFVDKYNAYKNEDLKVKLINSIITRKYAPVLEKRVVLNNIFEKCILEKDGIEYVDNFLTQFNLMFAILTLYTNLNCLHSAEDGIDDGMNNFDDYDLLMENDIYPVILYQIGEKEIKELMNIYSSIQETFMNQQTTEAYIAKQLTRFGTLLGTFADVGMKQLSEVLNNDEKMDEVTDKIKDKITDLKNIIDFKEVK